MLLIFGSCKSIANQILKDETNCMLNHGFPTRHFRVGTTHFAPHATNSFIDIFRVSLA